MPNSSGSDSQWQHPKKLLKIQKSKFKKQALQERINGNSSPKEKCASVSREAAFENIFNCKKRKNPFAKEDTNPKKPKTDECSVASVDPSADQTLFKILNQNISNAQHTFATSFTNILEKTAAGSNTNASLAKPSSGASYCPVDWTLKKRIRLISSKPFPWTQKLTISEEASGVTSFTRCLDIEQCSTSLDASRNAQFYQCCLYWQQPFLPWLTLFPRNTLTNNTSGINLATSSVIKNSLYNTWNESLRSLYQLIRTRQCPYFYVCANSFTAVFCAAGIFGCTDLNVMVTPTTRGFRHLLKEDNIEFKMPLKPAQPLAGQGFSIPGIKRADLSSVACMDKLTSTCDYFGENGPVDEEWLNNFGVNADEIKNINDTQATKERKMDCQIDTSEQSLILIEGVEVNGFFNFLINCKSAIATTGPLAGVPPTLLAPVSFHGATLNSLKVKDNKVLSDGLDYFSLELTGPILPSTIHNIFNINSSGHSITMTFSDIESTRGFSKVFQRQNNTVTDQNATAIFGKENLSDCGLSHRVLRQFCSADTEIVCNLECLKYSGESQCFTWT